MKIANFIEKTGKTESLIILKNTITVKEYLPFSEKKALAKRIVEKSTIDDNGFMIIDEVNKYLVFTIEVLSAYTDLIFDKDLEVAAKEFDMLIENNKLNILISMFEKEYKMMLEFVSMEVDTVLQRNSTQYQTAQFLNGLNQGIELLTEALKAKIEEFNFEKMGISTKDITQLKAFLGKFGSEK